MVPRIARLNDAGQPPDFLMLNRIGLTLKRTENASFELADFFDV